MKPCLDDHLLTYGTSSHIEPLLAYMEEAEMFRFIRIHPIVYDNII